MSPNFKLSALSFIVAGAILVAFLAVIFFSLPTMADHETGAMSETCLFPTAGAVLCADGGPVALFHHIASYQSFINVSIGFSSLIAWLTILLLASVVIVRLRSRDFLSLASKLQSRANSNQLWQSQPQSLRLKHWLAFLTNSPTLT